MSVRAIIVPSGGANYGSLIEACRHIGVDAAISADPAQILAATHVILPGVGAAAHAMRALHEHRLDRVLSLLRQPLLGICLGMQLLFDGSEEVPAAAVSGARDPTPDPLEGDGVARQSVQCLGLVPGLVRRLPAAPSWPHMGWNTLRNRVEHPLLDGIGDRDWFYFVHGYAAPTSDDTLAASDHGEHFAAVIARGNVFGAQFHPEKSAAAGRRLLSNFFALA